MRIYTLSLTTFNGQSTSSQLNQMVNILDATNTSRIKWYVNWSQFFNREDLGKVCRIKIKLISTDGPIATLVHLNNLGFLSANIGSGFGNTLDGMVLGMTNVLPSPNDATKNYVSIDTTQGTGVSGHVPVGSSELMLSFINPVGGQQTDVPDYICQLVFEIEE